MPRYLVERIFPDGLEVPTNQAGAETCGTVVEGNAEEGVTWIHSYVALDRRSSVCVYDGPSPEAIRRAGARTGLPIEKITEVRVLDPYFYVETT